MKPKLCIGTAQLGMNYGITNANGQVNIDEAKKILQLGVENGIDTLDTAQAYGSAETVIGQCWPSITEPKVISKHTDQAYKSTKGEWEKRFQEGLKSLNLSRLDSYLVHDSSDLKDEKGKKLLDWLISLKDRNLVSRIGLSIYSIDELVNLPLNYIDIVQLPISIYDQRPLENGLINLLASRNIAIYARSIFLQGLLLETYKKWPSFFSKEFIEHHRNFENYLQGSGQTLLQGALNFAMNLENIEGVLVGISTAAELKEVIEVWNDNDIKLVKNNWAWNNINEIDPSKWSQLSQYT